jgi:hypothetical protein
VTGRGSSCSTGKAAPPIGCCSPRSSWTTTAAPGAERIGRVLDEWKLIEQIKLAGPEIILISSYGIRIGDW